MRMRKINDHQIRCILSDEDLSDRSITVRDLRYGNRETKHLFRDMVSHATQEMAFNQEGFPVMIEAIPMEDNRVLVILTAVEEAEEVDPHFAKYTRDDGDDQEVLARTPGLSEEENAGRTGEGHLVLGFGDIDSVVLFCRSIRQNGLESALYRNDRKKGFYLVIRFDPASSETNILASIPSLPEYAEPVPDPGAVYGRLREHSVPVMEDPIRKLNGMK